MRGPLQTLCMSAGILLAFSPVLFAQSPAAPGQSGTLAEQRFKDIQVLKGIPADQLPPTMRYFTAALGRNCAGCHQAGATGTMDYAADTPAKKTARNMIRMVETVNAADYGVKINCGTCHQGHGQPAGLRAADMMSSDDILMANNQQANAELRALMTAAGAAPQQPNRRGEPGPPAAEVLKKYSEALGSPTAPIQSRAMIGTVTTRTSEVTPFTVTEKGKMYIQTLHSTAAPTMLGYDGTAGWSKVGDKVGGPNAGGFSLDSALIVADSQLPTDLQNKYKDLQSTKRSQMTLAAGTAPVDVNILQGVDGDTTEQFYFDSATGLLLRHVTRMNTALNGSLIETVDYANYRPEGGVMVPHKVIRNNWNTLDTYTISRVTLNGPVDEGSFKKPQ